MFKRRGVIHIKFYMYSEGVVIAGKCGRIIKLTIEFLPSVKKLSV